MFRKKDMDDYDVFCTYFDKILPLSLTWDGNQLIFNGFDWQHIACAISSFSGEPLSDWMCSSGKDYIEDREKHGIIVKISNHSEFPQYSYIFDGRPATTMDLARMRYMNRVSFNKFGWVEPQS